MKSYLLAAGCFTDLNAIETAITIVHNLLTTQHFVNV